jgi:hypothetical protein
MKRVDRIHVERRDGIPSVARATDSAQGIGGNLRTPGDRASHPTRANVKPGPLGRGCRRTSGYPACRSAASRFAGQPAAGGERQGEDIRGCDGVKVLSSMAKLRTRAAPRARSVPRWRASDCPCASKPYDGNRHARVTTRRTDSVTLREPGSVLTDPGGSELSRGRAASAVGPGVGFGKRPLGLPPRVIVSGRVRG